MKPWLRRCALVLSLAAVSSFAVAQRDEILKAEREQNLKDAAQLAGLAEQLKQDLEKNDRFVLSISTLKKTDEIEKLVKRIRSRLRHN